MISSGPTVLGQFKCTCCCSELTNHDDHDVELGYMRCEVCKCQRIRQGPATQIVLQVKVMGSLTVANIERAAEMVRILGGPDETTLKRTSDLEHYMEVAADGALAQLEIRKLVRRTPKVTDK